MSVLKNRQSFSGILILLFIFTVLLLDGCPSGGAGGSIGVLPGSGPGGSANTAPTANAGPDQNTVTGSLISLDGSASSDPDGDLLSYSWSFTSRPAGSMAAFWSTTDIYPLFIADVAGTYVIQLIVNDGQTDSITDTVVVTATAATGNTAPIANAGPDQNVKTGTTVTLDGSLSFDAEWDPLTYGWLLSVKPAGSTATLSSTSAIYPTFTADKDGSYVIQLIVNDGQVNSLADSVTVTAATPVVVHVPDTGQTGDYTATFGEDSDYTIHPPSYADNGNGTVTDTVTGLMWQQQDDGTARDWNTAVTYCDTLALGGYSGWRLPDNRELINIVNYGISKPAIDTAVFPNAQSSGYWTSTEFGLETTSAWDVLFDSGVNDTSKYTKTNTHLVRCVRGEQAWPVLTDNGDGTVTDDTTTLMWQQEDDNVQRKWDDALLYCEGLSLAGYTDWRLPNVKELTSLTDYRFWPFTINHTYFPSTLKQKGTAVPNYWASTSVAATPNQAWGEKYVFGLIANFGKSSAWFVRCVRGGQ